MILSNIEIKRALAEGHLVIDPLQGESQIQTSAVDLYLGDEVRIWMKPDEVKEKMGVSGGLRAELSIDIHNCNIQELLEKYAMPVDWNDDVFTLDPGQLAIGLTREYVSLPILGKLAARVEGRSTIARLGLTAHISAPTIHSGFGGHIALELCNLGPFPLVISKQNAACQLVIERLGEAATIDLESTFQGQKSLTDR